MLGLRLMVKRGWMLTMLTKINDLTAQLKLKNKPVR